jgi:multiple sugar transport system substrate-binding protein
MKLKIENEKLKDRKVSARSDLSIFNFQFSIHLTLLIALALLSLTCTSRQSTPTTTIEFWGLGREGEVVVELLPQFYRENPGIRVDVQQIPWSAAHEKLLTAHVGDSFPDMAQIGNTWIPELVTLRAIEPLNARVATSKVVRRRDYFPGIWETNVVRGELYGVPWYCDTRVLFYRTDYIDHPPRTWSEWIAIMERLKRTSKDPHFMPLLLPTNEWPQPVILAVQSGAELVTFEGEPKFEDPRYIASLEFYLSIYRRGLAGVVSTSQVANLYQQFGEGEFVMFVSGPWDVGNMRLRLPAELQDKWSTAPMPAPDGTPYPGASLSGGSSLVISTRSNKQDACWKLIEFLSRPDNQMRFYELSGDLPAHRDAWVTPKLANDPQIAAFRLQLDHTAALPRIPEWENIATTIFEYGQLAARGKYTAREAALQLDKKVDTMLQKRRWVLSR